MARGWESKAVEEQMQERDSRLRAEEKRAVIYDTSPAVRERNERLESLRLSHARTVQQLERAANAGHRAMLSRAKQALEEEIKRLS